MRKERREWWVGSRGWGCRGMGGEVREVRECREVRKEARGGGGEALSHF